MESKVELKIDWFGRMFNHSFRFQLIVILLISLVVNLNTLNNDYALDDVVVLTQNTIVKKGFEGVPELLTTNYFKGYTDQRDILSRERYRPVTLIVFAIEYQLFGANPFVSHLMNLLLYLILIGLVFQFLRNIIGSSNGYFEFLATLLFSLHPVHTEVIANVKSRDEIITFIFLILACSYFLKWTTIKNYTNITLASFFFLLALLTKETAITYFAIFPLLSYYFSDKSIKDTVYTLVPFTVALTVYFIIRYLVVGAAQNPVSDISNSPYLWATNGQAFATKIFVVSKYVLLLLFPLILTSEYGYNQIPYLELNSPLFLASLLFVTSLLVFSFYQILGKSLISFCILYFFLTLSVGTNLLFDFGAPMAERMLFIPSLAFSIILALFFKVVLQYKSSWFPFIVILVLGFYSLKTVARNSEWRNNQTLFFSDILKSPNSSRLNLFVAEQYILEYAKSSNKVERNCFLDSAIIYCDRSLKIQPNYAYSYLRLGLAWFYKGDNYKAADNWIKARKLDRYNLDGIRWSNELSIWFNDEGVGYKSLNKFDEAKRCFEYALLLNPNNLKPMQNKNLLLTGNSGPLWKE